MRLRPLLAVAVLLATTVAVLDTGTPVSAAPAGCTDGPSGFVMSCDQSFAGARPRGPIGLLGDSVLLGSNNGMSTPGLPTMLAAKGWGPIRMTTVLGMRTRNDTTTPASAYHVLGRWKAAGFNPVVIVVNLGANHIGDCTTTTVSVCKAKIDALLDRITSLYPAATVWWAKVLHETYGKGTGFSPGMLGWNAALDQAAKQRSNLVVWDWPRAVATSNPVIKMDAFNVHPISATEYVKRSTLITAHLLRYMPSHFAGPSAPLPAASAVQEFTPAVPPAVLYATAPASPPRPATLAKGTTRVVDLTGNVAVPGSAAALALTVSVSGSVAAGVVSLYSCVSPTPAVPSVLPTVTFRAGQRRSASTIVRLAPAHDLCIYASQATDVTVGLQGSFVPPTTATLGLTPITPVHRAFARGTTTDFVVPVLAGAGAVTANISIADPSAAGYATVHQCGTAPTALRTVEFARGEFATGGVFAPTAGGALCVHVQSAAGAVFGVAVDVTAVLRAGLGAGFRATGSIRLLDTRDTSPRGGWFGHQAARQTLWFPAAPPGAVAASGTLTMVAPLSLGGITAYRCGTTRPATSAAHAGPGTSTASLVTSAVDSIGRLCLTASTNTDTVFDVAGWWMT